MLSEPATPGVVLAGAAALGAYEAGVLRYVTGMTADVVSPFKVVCGTSAGAINAVTLASDADRPARGVARLCDAWSKLRLSEMLRPSALELLAMALDLTPAGRLRRALRAVSGRGGGLLNPAPILRLIEMVPLWQIAMHLRAGHLRGIALSATNVATGRAVVFHQAIVALGGWPAAANVISISTKIRAEHVLASTAIPLLFPTVVIDHDIYCDGGLRQVVPLSPAVRLGADRILVVNPLPDLRPGDERSERARRVAAMSPLYLAGKAIDALFADRIEADLERMRQVNRLLRAGQRRFGATFERELNDELVRDGGAPLRAIETVQIEPSRDLGAMAAEYVTSAEFMAGRPGLAGHLLRWIADGDPERVGDLLSFVLFDGGFAAQLIELGEADARAHRAELEALLAPVLSAQRARA